MASAVDDVRLLEDWVTRACSHKGAVLCIRPLRPDDRDREIAYLNSLSERSRYFRLFTPLQFLPRHLSVSSWMSTTGNGWPSWPRLRKPEPSNSWELPAIAKPMSPALPSLASALRRSPGGGASRS